MAESEVTVPLKVLRLLIKNTVTTQHGYSNGRSMCWDWVGATQQGRPGNDNCPVYGQVVLASTPKMKRAYAHNYVYELFIRKVPKGKELHHKCRNGLCVNPWHMEELTRSEHRKKHNRLRRKANAEA